MDTPPLPTVKQQLRHYPPADHIIIKYFVMSLFAPLVEHAEGVLILRKMVPEKEKLSAIYSPDNYRC